MAERNGELRDAATPDDEMRRREIEARGWAAIEEIRARNAHISPEDVLAEVTAEVELVRQEMYEQRTGQKGSLSS